VLDLNKIDRNTYQQVMAGRIGGEGYDGGHLIANLFGGAGERVNLIPQLSDVNRGVYRAMEGQWADAIRAGRQVRVEVSPIYSGSSAVPAGVNVNYWIDGRPSSRFFPNS
jgi:hypothetical protein